MAAIAIEPVEAADVRRVAGYYELVEVAWGEARGSAPRPVRWPVLPPPAQARTWVAREPAPGGGERLLGLVCARPAPGMNMLEFLYARPGPERGDTVVALVRSARAWLRERDVSRVLYVAFNWWRTEPFAPDLVAPLAALGMRRLEGVYLAYDLRAGAPAPAPVPTGYRVVPWEDGWFEQACAMMLRSPEPDPIYWDMGLCRRSIEGAAAPGGCMFPGGLGQLALAPGGELAAFSLATVRGYINHVYTAPEHRGRGLGAAVLTRVLGAIAERGLERATILTHDNNPGAIRLYRRLGFELEFTFPQFFERWEEEPS
ncbi:MAG: hypothetical protein KatS3mg102_0201 [Planctomycetota bacterium]|nr:MAG: hypothetical protein KatS3mg102_0201 [Planctomycetota bacterium]